MEASPLTGRHSVVRRANPNSYTCVTSPGSSTNRMVFYRHSEVLSFFLLPNSTLLEHSMCDFTLCLQTRNRSVISGVLLVSLRSKSIFVYLLLDCLLALAEYRNI
jgi:hypothetical protein